MDIENVGRTIDLDKVLDVTVIEPRLKHPTIFKYFDSLKPGEYFIIHNDHDPKPVYYQLLGERGNIFTFEYLSKGPEEWFIQVQKTLIEKEDKNVGNVSEKEQKKASFFAAKGQGYSCNNGKKDDTLTTDTSGHQEVPGCNTDASDPASIASFRDDIILQYDKWNASFLCDFIEQTDHCYFKEQARQLDELGEHIRLKHQKGHPELASLKMYQDQLLATLLFHLTQEKSVLFDSIKQIEKSDQINRERDTLLLRQIYTGTTMKKQANKTLAKLLEHIRFHCAEYNAPADACDAYIYYIKGLSQFDLRLSRYLHLENTILLAKINKWF
ncbi:DUF2249 domain-containing protein [Arachidicoccus terrestris]|uniref:DUF2249 domain-containing protein n=1 Tax=Arachidicoccus terrestris TaxID=2875539 RepID=UPI001CC5334C|nr:DUF2249 domain-containing protein [Arachidicoccus terrestris]UAY54699.1 DUF2249 domain-containing protein [Arachidicoccus terrestris]